MSENKLSLTPRLVVQLFIVLVIMPLSPILLSGRWQWWQGWVYTGIASFGFILSRAMAARAHPDLLKERADSISHQDVKEWDKLLSRLMGFGAIALPVAVGLEHRFGTAGDYRLVFQIAGLALIIAGYALGTWALIANRFFSGVVRIQHDRGHRVVSQGPYQFLRHPGYLGAVLSYLGTPMLLDGSWSFLVAILLLLVAVIRTRLEDRTLQQELEGYQQYAGRVRSKLIPGIW